MLPGMIEMSAASTSVAGLGRGLEELAPTAGRTASIGVSTPFAELLSGAVSQVGAVEKQASAAVEGLMTGTGTDIHTAMIATEKASMAFELALAVRNKAVQAYQSVMGMQF